MSNALNQFARHARQTMTSAEEKLWFHLRRQIVLNKTHFRRQVVLKNYIVDFCCHASRLIVEVDGATHSTDFELQKDHIRTRHLETIGYRVLRVTNDEVFNNIDGVLDTIYAALQETPEVISEVEKVQCRKRRNKRPDPTPTPCPSPQGGREKMSEAAHLLIPTHTLIPSPLEGEG
jgi:very-short-patch-repair endonuclease